MNRNHAVVLVLILAVVAAVVVLQLPRGAGPQPIDGGSRPASSGGPADQRSAETDRIPERQATAGRTEVAPANPAAGLHPSVRAALTGFTGRVVDSFGRPVAASQVRLFRFAPDVLFRPGVSMFVDESLNEPQIEAGEDRTGDDGRFTIDGVFPRAVFLLHADADGDAPTWRVVQRDAPPGELADLGDVVLNECGVLTGLVFDQDGQPVADALVRAVDLPGTVLSFVPLERFDPDGGILVSEQGGLAFPCPSWVRRRFDQLPIPSTRTGADGAFRLAGVAPGGNLVAVTARGFLSNVRPRVVVDPGEEKDLGKLVLPEGEVAFGKVVDEDDEPIAGAEVMVAAKSANIPVHFASFADPTNADGEFELGGFPSGDAIVAGRRHRGEPWVITDAQPVTRDLVVKLPSVRKLTLDVVDADGERITAPRLQLTPGSPDEGSLEQAMWGVTSPLDLRDRVATAEDGRIVVRELPRGKYTLLVGGERHATSASPVDLTESSQELRVQLLAKASFEVLVLDPIGAPVVGASVFARAEGPRPRLPDAPIHVGTTGDDGTLTIDEVSATQVALTASHPAFGNADRETPLPPPAPIVLRFEAPGRIDGIVSAGGAPPPLGKWMVYLFARGRGGDAAFPDMPQLTAPDADGRFSFASCRPGSYSVGVQSSLDVITSAGKVSEIATNAFLQPELPTERVELTPGSRAEVVLDVLAKKRIDGPTGIVRGSVMVDGRLGAGYILQGFGPSGRIVAEVDAGGMFDFGPVAVGEVQLQLIERPSGDMFSMRGGFGSALWSQSVKIEENKDVDLTIDVQLGQIGGIVIATDGSPADGTMVSAVRTSGEGGRMVRLNQATDASGRFAFEKAPTGTYVLEASKADVGRARLPGVVVESGLPALGVRLELVTTRKVSGTVDMKSFGADPPRRLWLSLQAVDGGGDSNASSRANEDRKFEFENVLPGRYRIQIYGGSQGQLQHDGELVVGNADIEDFVIRPVEPPPPHQHK